MPRVNNEDQRERERISRELRQSAENAALLLRSGHSASSIEDELGRIESSIRETRRLLDAPKSEAA